MATDKVSLTLDTVVRVVAAAGAVTATTLIQEESTGTWSLDEVELILYTLHPADPKAKSANKQIVFSTWTLEQVNVPAVTNWNHVFSLDPSCMNVIALMPATPNAHPITFSDNLSSFRLRLNDIDMTSEDVVYPQSLYKDRILMTWENMGKHHQLKNLQLKYDDTAGTTSIICNPIPVVNERQQFQITMNGSANFTPKVLYLYKHVIRTLDLSGTVQVR